MKLNSTHVSLQAEPKIVEIEVKNKSPLRITVYKEI